MVPLSCIKFEGRILERGFWLYVWKIFDGTHTVLYVGRTGDNSSPYASSPFGRVGQHLDSRSKAKANSLYRNLRREKLKPMNCSFEMYALGPLYPEQKSWKEHQKYRDVVAPIEAALAVHLGDRGYRVIGNHGSRKALDEKLFRRVTLAFDERFPAAIDSRDTILNSP